MQYSKYEDYQELYKDGIDEQDFNRLLFVAEKKIDNYTTCVNGVKKLKVAFPMDDESVEAISRCACDIVHTMWSVEEAEKSANESSTLVEGPNGVFHSKVAASVNSGSESISYATTKSTATLVDVVLTDKKAQEQLYRDSVETYLRGVLDDNGVPLLFRGTYPTEYL